MTYRIDNLQYANWSEKIFREMREGGVDARLRGRARISEHRENEERSHLPTTPGP